MVNKCLYGTNHIKLKDGRNEHKFTFLCEINSKDENDIRAVSYTHLSNGI